MAALHDVSPLTGPAAHHSGGRHSWPDCRTTCACSSDACSTRRGSCRCTTPGWCPYPVTASCGPWPPSSTVWAAP